MKNVSEIDSCFGCGVCSLACGRKIIDLQLSEDGFYHPTIQEPDKCTECGLCLDVCSYRNNDLSSAPFFIKPFAAWSQDGRVRRSSSSGGVVYEISKYLIERGFKVCGVRYNVEQERAEHYLATTIDDLSESIGSKYLQSYSIPGLKGLNKKDKFVVIGTPCQIDSLRRYIKRFKCEDIFILVDFFCHGVPSYLLWKKYIKESESKVGKVLSVSWRNKWRKQENEGLNWHDSWDMHLTAEKGTIQSKLSEGDLFYRFFIGNYCLNDCCYDKCRFKYTSSSADIRVGDCWGKEYKNNKEGVSAVLALTEKGAALLNDLKTCSFYEKDLSIVTEGQLRTTVVRPFVRGAVLKRLKGNWSLKSIHNTICKPYIMLNIPKRVIRKLIKR